MVSWKEEWKPLLLIVASFLVIVTLPLEWMQQGQRLENALWESLYLLRWYAQEHVILCLIPAFFIAGALAAFLNQGAILKFFGAQASKWLSYSVASVAGTLLAVCSCTVLPLFAGIYRMGAGLGPATAFLYASPAINVMAIVLTTRVLGFEMGVARAVGAIGFSVLIGLCMHVIFHREEQKKKAIQAQLPEAEASRPLGQSALFFGAMVGILIFANWTEPASGTGMTALIFSLKWLITTALAILLGIVMVRWFGFRWQYLAMIALLGALAFALFPHVPLVPFTVVVVALSWFLSRQEGEMGTWIQTAWDFTKQIMPLLFFGILIAGALLGRPGQEALIPSHWITSVVGDNSFQANFLAAVAGAFMYFATLTEIPILQGLMGSGMHKGPALALLLAGPALSLPNMLVIRSILGAYKTMVFVVLVVLMATLSGMMYGYIF